MEMWNGKCGVLELGLSEHAAKVQLSAKAVTPLKGHSAGQAGSFFAAWKMQAAFLPSSFYNAF